MEIADYGVELMGLVISVVDNIRADCLLRIAQQHYT